MDEYLALQQQVQMFTHWPSQGILNRDDSTIGLAGLQGLKYLYRPAARNDSPFGHKLPGCLMAEGSSLALDGNFHPLQYTLEQLSIPDNHLLGTVFQLSNQLVNTRLVTCFGHYL